MQAPKKYDFKRTSLIFAAALCCLLALALLFWHYAPPYATQRIALSPLPAEVRAAREQAAPAVLPMGEVNLNTAGVEELCTLNGVGPALAQRIIEEREQNGRFAYAEDILCVSGIGEKTFGRLLGQFCLD